VKWPHNFQLNLATKELALFHTIGRARKHVLQPILSSNFAIYKIARLKVFRS